jgi:Class III cytochrome C family
MSRTNARRIAIAFSLGGALLVSYPAVSGGLLWDLGAACGYICLILFLCLYVFPVRGDGLPHGRLMALSRHKSVGWCVLAAAIAHVLVLLPSAPLFMWCGVVALLSVVASVVTGLSARSHMRRPPENRPRIERSTLHIVLAAVLMLTACAHAIGSSQLLSGTFKTILCLVSLALPLGWYAVRRRPTPRSLARPASHIAAVGFIALLPTSTSKQLLLEQATQPDKIAVIFPHDLHTSVSCVTCHHNYVDHTGTTACIECHRSARSDLLRCSESEFHTFCRGCHTQLSLDGQPKHGPTRSCAGCHENHGIRSKGP